MNQINQLMVQREDILKKIKEIEETCEGIENEENAKKISELNMKQAKLSGEKNNLRNKLSSVESELNRISEEIRRLSGIGIDKILEAIKKQRWYFFKNRSKVFMDKETGILWPNLDYFNYCKEGEVAFSSDEAENIIENLEVDGIKSWKIPTPYELWEVMKAKDFPFKPEGSNIIKGKRCNWFVDCNNNIKGKDSYYNTQILEGIYDFNDSYLLPCTDYLVKEDYEKNVSSNNKVYTEKERLQFTLKLFINNGLEPIFDDVEVTQLYKKIFIEKPALIQELNQLQKEIDNLQQVVLLSSAFDYNSLLLKYDIKAIDSSIIKYHEAISSIIDDLMDKLNYYENAKNEIIRDFNVIGLKLSKKYEDNPNLTDEENNLLKNRQVFFKKNFEIGMNSVKSNLLSIKNQAEDIEERIAKINSGDNAIRELAILEKEERASFKFLVENAANIIKRALKKIEFFEANRKFATKAIQFWDSWSEDYKVFKTTLKDDLKNACEDDSIESDIYNIWYSDWQKKRFVVEERFLPLIKQGLKGSLINDTEVELTVIEQVIIMLQEYKDGIDKFYIEERKNIYQRFAFQAGGDLQEKFEAESELYKLTLELQKKLQNIIFSLEKSEDRIFLLKWAENLLDLQIDEILDFVKDKELSKISMNVLTDFADLKRKNFDIYISDSKAYSEELQRREKEYNSLIFKMRKDLMKQ